MKSRPNNRSTRARLGLLLPVLLFGMLAAWAQSYRDIPNGLRIGMATGTATTTIAPDGDADFAGDVTANAFIGDGSGLTGISGTKHTIEDEGTPLTARTKLNFVGAGVAVTDDSGDDATVVTISSGGGLSAGDITGLTEVTPVTDDLLVIVDDTDGALKKVNASNFLAGAGTVTSVAISGSDGLEVDSGSPITSSGTIALGVNKAGMLTFLNVADGAEVNAVDSVNSQTGVVVLDADDIDDSATTNKFVTASDITNLSNLSGTNTGDQDISSLTTGPGATVTDDAVATFNGTGGLTIQETPVTIAQSTGNMAGVGTLNTHTIPGGTGTLALTSDLHTAVTFAGTPDYLSLSGQQITLGLIDQTTDITGITPVANGGTGATSLAGASIPTYTSTNTFTNKRITPRVGTTSSSATPTINTDDYDVYVITAQAADITSFTTNLSGTPTSEQSLRIAITGTAARAITWGASFEAGAAALPTTTVTTQRIDVQFFYNAATSKWRCMAAGPTS